MADGSVVLKARVAAAPSEGEANAALIRLIAKAAGVPTAMSILVAGAAWADQAARDFRPRPDADCGAGENRCAALRLMASGGAGKP